MKSEFQNYFFSTCRVTPSTGYSVDGLNREQKKLAFCYTGQAQGYADAQNAVVLAEWSPG